MESVAVIKIQPLAESIPTELAATADAIQNVTHQARQLESELGGEYNPSTVHSRVSSSNISIYSQNLMPIHLANFNYFDESHTSGWCL
jgi:hypothetical protein